MQTGSDLRARGDQRGRGTRIEYDRKGKYPLYLGNEVLPKMPYSVSGVVGRSDRYHNAHVRKCPTIYLPRPLLQNLSPASSREGEIHC